MKLNKAVKQALALLAAITLTITGVTMANAANVTNTFQDTSGTFFDNCTGEYIAFSGREHFQENVTTNPNGTFHIHITANFADVTGIGQTTGTKYHFPIQLSETLNLNAGEQETIEETLNVISDGSLFNEKIKLLIHLTVNANGVVTVHNQFSELTCTP
jgi:hypothetical protein